MTEQKETGWMLFDATTGNAYDYTSDPLVAGKWWIEAITDKDIFLYPEIDCEGDCCPHDQCRFGLKGGPSCSDPDDA